MKLSILQIIGIFILITIIGIVFGYFHRLPECYLIEDENVCGIDYYEREGICWDKFKLKQCCKGGDYLLKGVYGGNTCWWIHSGFNESLLNTYDGG